MNCYSDLQIQYDCQGQQVRLFQNINTPIKQNNHKLVQIHSNHFSPNLGLIDDHLDSHDQTNYQTEKLIIFTPLKSNNQNDHNTYINQQSTNHTHRTPLQDITGQISPFKKKEDFKKDNETTNQFHKRHLQFIR